MLTALLLAIQVQAPSDSITLADALARARTHRAVLTLASAQVAEARGAMRTAGAIPNPAVSYSHSGAVPTNHLLVDQPLDWMLRRGSDRAAAGAGVTRARADSAQTVVALAHEVRLGFWRALAAQRSQSLVEAQALQADSLARIAAARFRAGDISLLEQEQAALEAARAHQTASAAREGARVASAEFARALGLETAPRPAGRLDAGLDQPPDSTIDPATIPTVRAAVADSQAAAALARSTARARVPLPRCRAAQSGATRRSRAPSPWWVSRSRCRSGSGARGRSRKRGPERRKRPPWRARPGWMRFATRGRRTSGSKRRWLAPGLPAIY